MKQHIQAGTTIALIIAGILLLFLTLYKLATLLILVLIAIVITTGIDPLVTRLQARWRRMPRTLATILVLLLGILIILGIFTFFIVTAVGEAIRFAQVTWPRIQPDLLAWANGLFARYDFLPRPGALAGQLRAQAGNIAGYLWSTTRTVFGVVGGLFSLVTVFILTLFFTVYKTGITYTFLQLVPPAYQQQVRTIGHDAAQKMGGWLRGQLLLALIVTIAISSAMAALGVEYAILIGLIGGIGELIPMVGPYLAFFPALAIVLLAGFPLWKIIALIVFFAALSQVENYFLSPKIMERQVGVHPVTTILALLTGGSLLGLVGALLAIPLAAAGRVIMLEAVFPAIQQKSSQQISEGKPDATPANPPRKRKRKR